MKLASSAILYVILTIIALSILDVEFIYASKGSMLSPEKPSLYGIRCQFSWGSNETYPSEESTDGSVMKILLNCSVMTRILISALNG